MAATQPLPWSPLCLHYNNSSKTLTLMQHCLPGPMDPNNAVTQREAMRTDAPVVVDPETAVMLRSQANPLVNLSCANLTD